MLAPTANLMGMGLGEQVALITDGRFSGGTRGACIGPKLVIDRFDLRADGTYRGFEDFGVLNARCTDEKYRGSYET